MKSNKPKVLIFIDWYLPGYKAGGPISSCANVVAMLGNSIGFKIITRDRDYLDTHPYPNVEIDAWTTAGKAQVMYLSPPRQTLSVIAKMISEHPDYLIYINGLFSKTFSIFPLIAVRRQKRRAMVAPRGMLASGALGIKGRKKQLYLAFAKRLGLFSQIQFHATHSHEAEDIQSSISARNGVTVIPNIPALPTEGSLLPLKETNQIELLSIARVAQEKNTLFAIACLRSIPPDIRVNFQWIGPVYDTTYFEKCKHAVSLLPENVRISFPGSVPPNQLYDYYNSAHLFFLPTLGENYGHAIIESMLAGTPVLISDRTPWQRLEENNLGAAIPLDESNRFSDFIIEIARMNQSDYTRRFKHVAESVSVRIRLNEVIGKYKTLFS